MPASPASIHETFNSYFHDAETCVDFHLQDGNDTYGFLRSEEPNKTFLTEETPPLGYIGFYEAISKYSQWGNTTVTFTMTKNGKDVCIYQYSPDSIILPSALQRIQEKLILENGIYFKKKDIKEFLRAIDSEMSLFLREKFTELL